MDDHIVGELGEAPVVVVMLGKAGAKSPYLAHEIVRALERMRTGQADGLPGLLPGKPREIPYGLAAVQGVVTGAAAAQVVTLVRPLRGRVDDRGQRAMVGIVAVMEELRDVVEEVAERPGQLSLDGPIPCLDISAGVATVDALDLRMVLIGARHGGQPERLRRLVQGDAVVGLVPYDYRTLLRAARPEARET